MAVFQKTIALLSFQIASETFLHHTDTLAPGSGYAELAVPDTANRIKTKQLPIGRILLLFHSSLFLRRRSCFRPLRILTVSTQDATHLLTEGVGHLAGRVQVDDLFENVAAGDARGDQDQIVRRTHRA